MESATVSPTMSDTETTARTRFETLLAPHGELLRGYLHRLVGHRADAEDLLQETTLKAFERLPALRDDGAFRSWIFRIATSTALDHLRKQTRWRPYSQSLYEAECAHDDALRGEIVETTRDEEFAYDVREHIAFCFACVGRSLQPDVAAALTLREVMGLSNREAADALEVSESVLRHHLSAGRRNMEETFEGLCSLVNKQGICRQCSSFRKVTAEPRRGPALPVLQGRDDAWQARLAIVRQRPFVDGVARSLHELMFARLAQLEAKPSTP